MEHRAEKNLAADRTARQLWVVGACVVLLSLGFGLSLAIGAVRIPLRDVIAVLGGGGSEEQRIVLIGLRLPRAIIGCLVGVCLSLAGCILQAVMRNDLASPTTIGVTGGASFAGYLLLVALPNAAQWLPAGTIIGAFATTLLIYLLSWQDGVNPVRMLLSGMAVNAMYGAFIDIIRLLFTNRIQNVQGFLVGGLNSASWDQLHLILPFALIGVVLCLPLPRSLNLLQLGDEAAHALGMSVERFRLFLIVIASLLAGSAAAVAGLVGFVGLIIPHMARQLVGSDHRILLPVSTLLGATMICLCDTIGRVIALPAEVPVSILLALLGTPYFLLLIRRRRRSSV